MQVIIYGKPGCPYCDEAKALAERVGKQVSGFTFKYLCIREEGMTKEDLVAIVGQEVRTVPQIFVGDQYVGGYAEFKSFIENEFKLDS